jgi:F0F1-type ATP synthase epsilon subunit
MIDQVVLESENGKLISYEKLMGTLTKGQVHRTLSQHHTVESISVFDGVAKVVLAGTV